MQESGASGFYRGYLTTVMREIPFAMIQFPLYEVHPQILIQVLSQLFLSFCVLGYEKQVAEIQWWRASVMASRSMWLCRWTIRCSRDSFLTYCTVLVLSWWFCCVCDHTNRRHKNTVHYCYEKFIFPLTIGLMIGSCWAKMPMVFHTRGWSIHFSVCTPREGKLQLVCDPNCPHLNPRSTLSSSYTQCKDPHALQWRVSPNILDHSRLDHT